MASDGESKLVQPLRCWSWLREIYVTPCWPWVGCVVTTNTTPSSLLQSNDVTTKPRHFWYPIEGGWRHLPLVVMALKNIFCFPSMFILFCPFYFGYVNKDLRVRITTKHIYFLNHILLVFLRLVSHGLNTKLSCADTLGNISSIGSWVTSTFVICYSCKFGSRIG